MSIPTRMHIIIRELQSWDKEKNVDMGGVCIAFAYLDRSTRGRSMLRVSKTQQKAKLT